MEAYLDEYRTNSDPIYQFVDSHIEETDENDFIPVQTMLDAVKHYCRRQGLDSPTEKLTRKRLRELLGATVQKRVGQHQERARGFAGYRIVTDRDDDYPF